MISSASPISLLARANPIAGMAMGKNAPAQGETGFSALFAGLMPAGEEAAAASNAQLVIPPAASAKAATTGKFAATATASGKNLPVSLPEDISADDEAVADAPASDLPATPGAVADAAMALGALNLPTVAPPATPVRQMVASQAASNAPALPVTAAPAAQLATTLPPAATTDKDAAKDIPAVRIARGAPDTAPGNSGKDTAAAAIATHPTVQLSVAAAPAQALPLTAATTVPTAAQIVKGKAPAADASTSAQPAALCAKPAKAAPLLPDSASPVTPDTAPPALAATTFSPAATAPAAAGQASTGMAATPAEDVARIVEQLAAAREAMAPASAALSVDHAEFGELSLRIDQRADGGIAVQLAASNPDAHRAVSAAMGAQGQQLSPGDGQHGSASAQGNAADREARQQRQEQGQDRAHPRGQAGRNANTAEASNQQSGTFA